MSSGGEALSAVLGKVDRRWVMGLVVGIFLVVVVLKLMNPDLIVQPGMTAPDFALESTDGKIFTISKLRGVPVILSFWSTDCPDCISELAGKSQFFRSHPEVEMLGIAVDSGGLDDLAAAKKELGITYPVVESNTQIETSYGVKDLPLTLLIDDQGMIEQVQEGKISKQRLTVWMR